MSMPEPAVSFTRPPPNLFNAWGGIWRLTFNRYLTFRRMATLAGMVAILVVIAETQLSSITGGGYSTSHHEIHIGGVRMESNSDSRTLTSTERYLGWTGSFYLGFLLPILALITAGGALRDDLKPGTADYVFTRPVPRTAYLAFKYLAHTASAQTDFVVALGLVLLAGQLRGIPGLASAMPHLLIAQLTAVAAYSALGFLFGVLTTRYVIAGLAYIAIVEFGVGNIPTQINRIAIARQVKVILAPVSGAGAVSAPLVLIAACVLVVAVAAAIFSRQELAGGQGREE